MFPLTSDRVSIARYEAYIPEPEVIEHRKKLYVISLIHGMLGIHGIHGIKEIYGNYFGWFGSEIAYVN